MRRFLIAGAALIVVAAPALAQPPAYEPPSYEEDWDDADVAVAVDPREVARMAHVMDRLVGAVMDLPIGPIVVAVDPLGRSGYHPGATVRDMATRDDPYAEARIRAGIHGASRGIGAMSEALQRMMPALRRSFDEVSRSIEQAIDEADLDRPY